MAAVSGRGDVVVGTSPHSAVVPWWTEEVSLRGDLAGRIGAIAPDEHWGGNAGGPRDPACVALCVAWSPCLGSGATSLLAVGTKGALVTWSVGGGAGEWRSRLADGPGEWMDSQWVTALAISAVLPRLTDSADEPERALLCVGLSSGEVLVYTLTGDATGGAPVVTRVETPMLVRDDRSVACIAFRDGGGKAGGGAGSAVCAVCKGCLVVVCNAETQEVRLGWIGSDCFFGFVFFQWFCDRAG